LFRHSIRGVRGQVHDDLVDLRGVGENVRQLRIKVSADLDSGAQSGAQQLQSLLHHRREFDDVAFRSVLAAESEDLADELRGSQRCFLNLREVLLHRMIGRQVA
jgi:hypothetical protein